MHAGTHPHSTVGRGEAECESPVCVLFHLMENLTHIMRPELVYMGQLGSYRRNDRSHNTLRAAGSTGMHDVWPKD